MEDTKDREDFSEWIDWWNLCPEVWQDRIVMLRLFQHQGSEKAGRFADHMEAEIMNWSKH